MAQQTGRAGDPRKGTGAAASSGAQFAAVSGQLRAAGRRGIGGAEGMGGLPSEERAPARRTDLSGRAGAPRGATAHPPG